MIICCFSEFYTKANVAPNSVNDKGFAVETEAIEGPVGIAVTSLHLSVWKKLIPRPRKAILALNGEDLGRHIFSRIDTAVLNDSRAKVAAISGAEGTLWQSETRAIRTPEVAAHLTDAYIRA